MLKSLVKVIPRNGGCFIEQMTYSNVDYSQSKCFAASCVSHCTIEGKQAQQRRFRADPKSTYTIVLARLPIRNVFTGESKVNKDRAFPAARIGRQGYNGIVNFVV